LCLLCILWPNSFIIDVIRPAADGNTLRATTPSLSTASVPTDLVYTSSFRRHPSPAGGRGHLIFH
jgi:hypothetical protein